MASFALMTVILAAALTADAQDIVVGFEQSAYSVAEGESLEICVTIISPDDIGSTRVFLEVVPNTDAAENTATPDQDDTLFGGPLMIAGADYIPPFEGGLDQILDMPLTQSARNVCYTQQTYQDEDDESDEVFTIRIIPDRRPENMLDNLVIDEERGSVHVTIIDDDGVAPTDGIITMCPQLDNPDNGQVEVTDFGIGAMATYTCNSGYQMNGSDVLTCGDDGQWSPNPPTCTLIVCDRLEDPENGQVMYFGDSGVGEVANFDCNTGYMLEGPDNVTCGADYQWSTSPPTCTLIVCERLEDPENGEVTYSGEMGVGEMANFECNPGYKLQGTSSLFCLETGEWDGPTAPTCVLDVATVWFDPATYTVSEGDAAVTFIVGRTGNVNITANFTFMTQPDTADGNDFAPRIEKVQILPGDDSAMVVVDLKEDKMIEGSEIFFGVISAEDVFTSVTSGTANVTIIDNDECPTLQNIENGVVNTTGFTNESVATYTCNEGYRLVGDAQRVCSGSNSEWSGAEPSCEEIKCPDLSAPANGAVTLDLTSIGAMANFSCNSGYFLVGEPSLTCGGDGTWSAEPPQCIENCATLPAPADGRVEVTGNAGGDTATFSCDPGFILEGEEILTCRSDRTWDHAPPICVPLLYMVGFRDNSFDVTEGESIEICVDVISPPDIGDAEIYIEVLPSSDLPSGVTSATQDDIHPIFGTYLMVPGADYAQPLEGGAHQIFNMPLSQSQRSVCYQQQTYEDTAVEGDEYFSLRVATEARTLSNVVINETLNTTLVRIIDDDDNIGYRVQFNPNTYTVTEGTDEFVELIIQIEKEHNEVLIVNISLIQQSAEAGSDYVATTMVEALAPGQREERVRVLIIDDSTAEETETFTAILTTGDMDTPAMATVTILDDDGEEKASESGAVTSYTGIIIAVSAVIALLLIAAIIIITVLIMIFKRRRKRQKKFDLPSPEPIYDDLDGPYYSSILEKTNQIKAPDVLPVEPEVQLQTKDNEAYGVPPADLRKTVAVPIQQQENVAYGVLPNHQQSQSSGVESEEQL